MSQVSTRVRGINALLTVVDFAAGAIGSAEGELAQKDAVIRQLSEQLAAREREKAAADAEAIGLASKFVAAHESAASMRCLIRDLVSRRDAAGAPDGTISVRHFDVEIDALREFAT